MERLEQVRGDESGGQAHEQGDPAGGERHRLQRVFVDAEIILDRNAHMEDPVDCPGLVEGGLVDGVEAPAGQGRQPVVGFTLADEGLGGTVVGEPGADRPVAVLLLHGGRASDEGVLDRS